MQVLGGVVASRDLQAAGCNSAIANPPFVWTWNWTWIWTWCWSEI
jgi:hypothetical protein